MLAPLTDFAKLGLGLNSLFPCKHDPEMHVEALTRIVNRTDIEVVDLTVPYGSDYRLAVANLDGTVSNFSGYFSIGSIDVTYPNGGETLVRGQNYQVTWTAPGISGNVKVEVYKGTQMFKQLAANDPNDGSCPFTPDATFTDGNNYRIAVATLDGTVWNYSGYFSITGGVIDVTYPDGGETLVRGQNYNVTWTSSGISGNIKVEVYKGSQMFRQLAADDLNDGSCPFTPTAEFPDGSDYRIAVANLSGTVSNFSGYFTIQSDAVSSAPVLTPLYRMYKGNPRDHFYTISKFEKDNAVASYGYTFERIECYISSRNFVGGTPLYRLYHSSSSTHFYTSDPIERDTRLSQGYVLEGGGGNGIEGYVFASALEGLSPLRRLHQTKDTPYHYFMCIRDHEYLNAVVTHAGDWGFVDEGVVGYVSSDGLRDPLAHRRPQANFGGVDLGTGAYRGLNSLDLSMKGRGPDLSFAHYYNSFGFNDYPMGVGWSHSLDSYITEEAVTSTDRTSKNPGVITKWGDGSVSSFQSTGLNSTDYVDSTGNHDQLTRINDSINYGYNLTKNNQVTFEYRRLSVNPPPEVAAACTSNPDSAFCSKIVLLRIKDWTDNELAFEYDASAAALKVLNYFVDPELVYKGQRTEFLATDYSTQSFEVARDPNCRVCGDQ